MSNISDKLYWALLALFIMACLVACLWFINRPIEIGQNLQIDTSAQDDEESKRLAMELIIKYEGLRLKAYPDGPECAIGYGHHGVDCSLVIDKEQADIWLIQDIDRANQAIDDLVANPLRIGQRAALISFVFNFNDATLKNSTLLQKLNSGNYDDVPGELERWVYAEADGEMKVQGGLVARRAAEVELWNR